MTNAHPTARTAPGGAIYTSLPVAVRVARVREYLGERVIVTAGPTDDRMAPHVGTLIAVASLPHTRGGYVVVLATEGEDSIALLLNTVTAVEPVAKTEQKAGTS